ncbi:DNA polymerase III subunit delta [Symmachiella dynata]|uniref:DNA polymerase III subunit delta n=1 Tax=Symmachiella dynata TaxID=2527995 RepID=UPI0011886D05|nr:DNA polymerase III subunit delta [Symmachiella dynata]QDT48297.1 DNA polymerase III subunit delta [Symmachiella dynata]
MDAIEYLKSPAKQDHGTAVAIYGAEQYLKSAALKVVADQILGREDEDALPTRFTGKDAELVRVLDELRTVSMWSDCRLVIVDNADDFVSKYRAGLEKYLDKPAKKSVLVLDLKSWPKNTKLAKKVAKVGLDINCAALKPAQVPRWIAAHARQKYGKTIDGPAAQILVELAGTSLAQLDTELDKLSTYVGETEKIDAEAVRILVGGWRAETTWAMLDAVRDGQVGQAIGLLDKLLAAGEAPMKLLGGINFTYRRIAKATEISRHGMPLADALKSAGMQPFVVGKIVSYMRRIGRPRAEQIYGWLADADMDLKGSSSLSDRAVLELLLLRLGGRAGT